MHAHEPDRDLPPAAPRLGKLRLHREEAARSVAPRDNLPSELELGRSAPVLRISARRKVESCILLPVAEGELAVDVVDSCLAVTHLVGIERDLVVDEVTVLVDQRPAESLARVPALRSSTE